MPKRNSTDPEKVAYNKSLDGLRGIAILLVLLWHYIACLIRPGSGSISLIRSLLASSWSGVDLFFVLSGFLLGRILLVNIHSSNYYSTFYIRRILRIFPLYYLFLILYFIVRFLFYQCTQENSIPSWAYFAHIQNFFMKNSFGDSNLGITWSLAIEEQFYLLLPLLIRFSRQYIKYIILTGIILAPVLRYFFGGNAAYVLLPARIDSLLIGVGLAYLYVYDKLIWVRNRTLELIVLIAIILGLIALLSVYTEWNKTGGVFNHSVYAILYSIILLITVEGRWKLLNKILETPVLIFIGKISYGLYLIHVAMITLVFFLIKKSSPTLNSITDFLIVIFSFLICVAVLFLSNKYFETPIRSLGKKHSY